MHERIAATTLAKKTKESDQAKVLKKAKWKNCKNVSISRLHDEMKVLQHFSYRYFVS